MKKVLLFIAMAGFACGNLVNAQEEEQKFGISFSGFVKNDFFWDSRQVVTAREGHFLLWPSSVSLDNNNIDMNDRPNFNFLAIQTRLSGKITGPDALGAKTSGLIEGDFFAQANDNINLFRMRHAFIKLNWKNTELLTGQYWNPFFVTGCFPGTVSFNTGTPLQSFARNPQARLTHSFGNLSLVAAALSQRDMSSRGPNPANPALTLVSSQFLRNSAIPDLHFQVHYSAKNAASGTGIHTGAGLAYKKLVPRLESNTLQLAVDESVSGFSALLWSKLSLSAVTVKLQARYGENIADLLSISGFAVKSLENPVTGEQTYTPLKNMTLWGEVHTNGDKIQVGIFGGYLKNMGTKEEMDSNLNTVYGLGTNISSLYRISPRIVYISKKTKIAAELEYTTAAYGSNFNTFYLPSLTTDATNIRLLLSVIYSF